MLDGLRLMAALVVLLDHAAEQWLTAYPRLFAQLENMSHVAVVVFFVLSGYLIAYTTTSNNRGPRQYAVARLSRLYSIVLPALVLTGSIELIIHRLNPGLAAEYVRGSSWPRYVLSLFFCNEVSFLSASPPLNGPLWSLGFEFWYYAIFGLWLYRGPGWKSWLLPAGACLLAGPKILALLPIWVFGWLAYRLPGPPLAPRRCWLLVGALLVGAGCAAACLPSWPYMPGGKPMFYAGQFVTDWVVGSLVAGGLWCLPSEGHQRQFPWVKQLRFAADLSFPLYVLHFPLLVLWRAVFGWQPNNWAQMGLATVVVSLVVLALGSWLEKRRKAWARFFGWLITKGSRLQLVAKKLSAASPGR